VHVVRKNDRPIEFTIATTTMTTTTTTTVTTMTTERAEQNTLTNKNKNIRSNSPMSIIMKSPASKDKNSINNKPKPKPKTLFVVYGSQTGNSEQAAKDFATKFMHFHQQRQPSFSPNFNPIQATACQLDDFLEVHHAPFSTCLPVLVIFVSSYGVGQAPIGAHLFRTVCERFVELQDSTLLHGLSYAICGLGDSTYTTYLKNPTTIDSGLQAAGAQRIGALGQADAHQRGEQAQDKVIQTWMETIWSPLMEAIALANMVSSSTTTTSITTTPTSTPPVVDYGAMQRRMIELLREVDPDYKPPITTATRSSGIGGGGFSCNFFLLSAALVGAMVVVVLTLLVLPPSLSSSSIGQ
jgi:sulfite reductase alpha subunit-like flavoprotein